MNLNLLIDPVKDKAGKFDVIRVGIALGVATFLSLSSFIAVTQGKFDPQDFGLGFGMILGGGGAGSMMHGRSNQ